MSTIDKASLIQIPSGYKNGKLYSVKPNPSYGSEQISNGDFSNGSTGWTVTNGTVTDKYNASMTAYQNGIKISTFSLTGTYKLIFDLTISSGNCKFDGGGSNSQTYTTSGRKELTITNPTKFEFNAFNLGWVGTLDNVSVKEVLVADGDFDFSRSSSATRVNSEGLIETASVLGSELITNGDFATDSDWTINDWSISGGSLNGSASTGIVFQNPSGVVVGKTYKVTLEVKSYTSGSIRIKFGGSSYSNVASQVGVQEFYIQAVSTGGFLISVISSFTGSIDNVSVKEVIENDVPRLDYSDGSCASLLLEGQRTNVINYSNDYTQWSNTQFTINGNSVTSPEGITNGTKIVPSTSNTEKYLDKGGFSRTSGQYITHTVYAKASGYNFLYLSNSASRLYAVYDLQQGLVIYNNSNGTDFNNHSASIELFGNGWYRCKLIGQAQSSVASYFRISCGITAMNSSTQGFFQGDGTSGIEVYGSQVELNASYATSYIPTSGSTVTRTADVCNNAGTSATFNDSEGVLFFEGSTLVESGITRVISLSDGSTSNNIYFNFNQNANSFNCEVLSGGSGQFNASVTMTKVNNNKIALKYKANDFALWINGTEVATDTSGSVPSGLDRLNFDFGQGIFDFYGKTKQLMVFDEALSDEELSDLTGQANLSFNNLATFYGYTIL